MAKKKVELKFRLTVTLDTKSVITKDYITSLIEKRAKGVKVKSVPLFKTEKDAVFAELETNLDKILFLGDSSHEEIKGSSINPSNENTMQGLIESARLLILQFKAHNINSPELFKAASMIEARAELVSEEMTRIRGRSSYYPGPSHSSQADPSHELKVIIDTLNSELIQLKAENTSLKKSESYGDKVLLDQIAKLENDLKKRGQIQEEFKNEMDAQVKKLALSILEKDDQINDLKQALEGKGNIGTYMNDYKETRSKILELESKYQELAKELEETKRSHEEVQDENKKLTSNLASVLTELSKFEESSMAKEYNKNKKVEDKEKINTCVNKLQEVINKTLESLAKISNNNKALNKILESILSLQSRIVELKLKLKKYKKKLNKKKKVLTEAEDYKKQQEDLLKAKDQELIEIKIKVIELRSLNKEMKDELEKVKEENSSMSSKLLMSETQFNKTNQMLKQNNIVQAESNNRTKSSLIKLQNEINTKFPNYISRITTTVVSIYNLLLKTLVKIETIRRANKVISGYLKESLEMNKNMEPLKGQIVNLIKENEEKSKKINEDEKQKGNLKAIINDYQKKINDLKVKFKENERIIKNQKDEIDSLQSNYKFLSETYTKETERVKANELVFSNKEKDIIRKYNASKQIVAVYASNQLERFKKFINLFNTKGVSLVDKIEECKAKLIQDKEKSICSILKEMKEKYLIEKNSFKEQYVNILNKIKRSEKVKLKAEEGYKRLEEFVSSKEAKLNEQVMNSLANTIGKLDKKIKDCEVIKKRILTTKRNNKEVITTKEKIIAEQEITIANINKMIEEKNKELITMKENADNEIKQLKEQLTETDNSLLNEKEILSNKVERLQSQLQEANNELNMAKESIKEMQATLESKNKELGDKEQMQQEIISMKGSNEALNNELVKYKTTNKKLEADNELLLKDKEKSDTECREVKVELEGVQKEYKEATIKLSQNETLATDLQKQLKNIQEAYEILRAESEKAKEDYKTNEEKLANKFKEALVAQDKLKSDLTNKITLLKTEIEKDKNTIKEQVLDIERLTQAEKETSEKAKSTIQLLKSQIADLKKAQENSLSKDEQKELQQRHNIKLSLNNTHNQFNAKFPLLINTASKGVTKLNDLLNRVKVLENNLFEYKEHSNKQKDCIQKNIKELAKEHEVSKADYEEKVTELTKIISDLKEEKEKLSIEYKRNDDILKEEISKLKNRIYEGLVNNVSASENVIRKELNSLVERVQKVKALLENSSTRINELKNDLINKEKELSITKRQLADTNTLKEQAIKENEQINGEHKKVTEELRAEIDLLNNKLVEKNNGAKRTVSETKQELEKDIEPLKEQIINLEILNKKLEDNLKEEILKLKNTHNQEIENIRKEKDRIINERQAIIEQQRENHKLELNKLTEKLSTYTNEKKVLEDSFRKKESEIAKLEEKNKTILTQTNNEKEVEEVKKLKELHEKEITDLKQELEQKVLEKNKVQEELNKKVNKLNEENTNLKKELITDKEGDKKTIQKLTQDFNNTETERQKLEVLLQEKAQSISKLNSQISELEKLNAKSEGNYKKEFNNWETRKVKLEKTIIDQKKDISQTITEHKKEVDKLNKQLSELRKEIEKNKEIIKKKDVEIEIVKEEKEANTREANKQMEALTEQISILDEMYNNVKTKSSRTIAELTDKLESQTNSNKKTLDLSQLKKLKAILRSSIEEFAAITEGLKSGTSKAAIEKMCGQLREIVLKTPNSSFGSTSTSVSETAPKEEKKADEKIKLIREILYLCKTFVPVEKERIAMYEAKIKQIDTLTMAKDELKDPKIQKNINSQMVIVTKHLTEFKSLVTSNMKNDIRFLIPCMLKAAELKIAKLKKYQEDSKGCTARLGIAEKDIKIYEKRLAELQKN